MLNMFEELELAICPLTEDRCAEGLHDLLYRDGSTGELIFGRAADWDEHLRQARQRDNTPDKTESACRKNCEMAQKDGERM